MGVASSGMHDTLSQILHEEPVSTLISDEIHKLTYEDFTNLLGELNVLSKKCLVSDGSQLVFAVKKDSDLTIFWKATVQIACVKIDANTQKVLAYRLMDLHDFLKVFKTLKCQISAAEHSESANTLPDVTMRTFLNYDDTEDKNECCICFERKQEVILPCAHSYCLPCIEEWNECHDTCPICREKLESTDETWVLSEVPNAEEISREIRENLLELTEDRHSLCNPS